LGGGEMRKLQAGQREFPATRVELVAARTPGACDPRGIARPTRSPRCAGGEWSFTSRRGWRKTGRMRTRLL
jgi:hypothetical protein